MRHPHRLNADKSARRSAPVALPRTCASAPRPTLPHAPREADISRIAVTSPSLGFHPKVPLGGKESTQRCHWGETRLPLDARQTARQAVPHGPEPGKPPDTRLPRKTGNLHKLPVSGRIACGIPVISGVSIAPEGCLCRLRRYSTQTTQARYAGAQSSDGRGWCYWSEHLWSRRRPPWLSVTWSSTAAGVCYAIWRAAADGTASRNSGGAHPRAANTREMSVRTTVAHSAGTSASTDPPKPPPIIRAP